MIIPTLFYIYNVSVIFDGSTVLPCDGQNVTWIYYPHIPIYEDIVYENNTKVGKYLEDDRYTVDNSSLYISNVRNTNKGHYLCIDRFERMIKFYNVSITNSSDEIDQDDYLYRTRFNRLYMPTSITTREIVALEGETVNFTCHTNIVGFNPEYIFVRYFKDIGLYDNTKTMVLYTESFGDTYFSNRDKVVITKNLNSYRVFLKNLSPCDSGVYECTVMNQDTSSSLLTLRVLPKYKSWWKKSREDKNWARRVRSMMTMTIT